MCSQTQPNEARYRRERNGSRNTWQTSDMKDANNGFLNNPGARALIAFFERDTSMSHSERMELWKLLVACDIYYIYDPMGDES